MKFVIRDDDLNYFSRPADIERWYADVFAEGIPVGFSAIPFVKPESDVYTGGSVCEAREYPIHENRELCAFVRAQPLVEILQHGTTHETVNGVYEYAGEVPLQEALRGREELESAFGRSVTIFVPPHDWIGVSGIRSVEAAGMNIIRGRGAGLRAVLPRPRSLAIFFRMLLFKAQHGFVRAPAYPHTLDFGAHKEACSYRLEDSDLFDGIEYARTCGGQVVVVTHLHSFTDEKKMRLLESIQAGKKAGAEFVLPSALFSAAF